MFTAFDKIFTFALHEEKCTLLPSVAKRLEVALCGAILAELALQGRIRVVEAQKLTLVDATVTGIPMLDATLEFLQKSEHPRKISYWLRHMCEDSLVGRKRMFERMVEQGVLKREDEGLSWVTPFPESSYPLAPARYAFKNRLREVVLAQAEPELSDLALLSVLKASDLLELIFTKGERRAAKYRIYTAVMDRVMNDPLAQTIQEIEVALDSFCGDL